MGSSEETITKIQNYLMETLNYDTFSLMTYEEFKEFTFNFFHHLNEYKNLGLVKQDIEAFTKSIYSEESLHFKDSDILLERRFEAIIEEVIEFCPDPFFWSTAFDTYIDKWNKAFEHPWYKTV